MVQKNKVRGCDSATTNMINQNLLACELVVSWGWVFLLSGISCCLWMLCACYDWQCYAHGACQLMLLPGFASIHTPSLACSRLLFSHCLSVQFEQFLGLAARGAKKISQTEL